MLTVKLMSLLLCCCCCCQVNSATRQGDSVVLEVEPAKGGEKSTMEVDVVLVSAGRLAACCV
jgi:lysine/ornithine N-monooxygenase